MAEIVHHEAFFGVGGAVAEQAHLVFLDFGAFIGVFAFYIMPEGGAEQSDFGQADKVGIDVELLQDVGEGFPVAIQPPASPSINLEFE